MSDLRALLHEPWCPKCGRATGWHEPDGPYTRIECKCGGVKMPLATRLPECVPPGLEWANLVGLPGIAPCKEQWMLNDEFITDEQAELLFIGKAVKVLLSTMSGRVAMVGLAVDRPDWFAALAAALHRLCDEKEKANV